MAALPTPGVTEDWGDELNAAIEERAVPTGGTTGQVLKKTTGTDRDTEWATITAVQQGDRLRQGARTIDPYDGVFLQTYQDDDNGMAIYVVKVGTDSTDINIDGAVLVKHGKTYAGTAGYADTVQLYTLAGSAGTIVGNNDFAELAAPPYAIPGSWTPTGFVRFELGPSWPASEVARFNNEGDFLLGLSDVLATSATTQSGTTVTRAAGGFTSSMVGDYVYWNDTGRAVRITGYTSSTVVTVEQSETKASTLAAVRRPRILFRADGPVESHDGVTIRQRAGQTGNILEVTDTAGSVVFAVDDTGITVGEDATGGGGTTTGAGELLMQDGVTGPPVPIENEARSDWLYEG